MKIKRVISLMLAIVMVTSLFPASYVSAGDSKVLTYEFNYKAAGADSNMTIAAMIEGNYDVVTGTSEYPSDSWHLLRYSNLNSSDISTSSVKFVCAKGASSYTNGAVLFEIDVDESGVYTPSLEYQKAARGGYLEVYVFDEDSMGEYTYLAEESAEKDSSLLSFAETLAPLDNAYVDTFDASSVDIAPHTFSNSITLNSEKRNFVMFVVNGANPDATAITSSKPAMAYVSSFSLTQKADDTSEPANYVYNFTSTAANLDSGIGIENATADATVGTSPWSFVQGYKLSSRNLYEDGYRMNDHASYAYNGTLLKISVGKDATYIPSVYYAKNNQAGEFRVFLFSEEVATQLELSLEFSANNGTDIKKVIDGLDPLDNVSIDGYSETATSEWTEEKEHKFNAVELTEGTYYLMFSVNDVSGEQKRAYIKSFSLEEFEAAGVFEKVELRVEGISNAGEPMPRSTEKQLAFKMIDSKGAEMSGISTDEISVAYASTDETVATVSENGVITALKNGETVLSSTITYNNITVTGEYDLVVEDKGVNLMANYNPDFESDVWVWNNTRQDSAPSEAQFMRVMIGNSPNLADDDNRAMGIVFDPTVAAITNPESIELSKSLDGGKRVKVDSGKFYELSFRIKIEDFVKPDDADDMNILLSIFGYTHPGKGDSLAAFKRISDISQDVNFRETYGDWVEFNVPVAAPTEYDGEVYLTPRISIRPSNENDLEKAGFSGTVWLDDFSICEVGYEGIELEVKDIADAVSKKEVTVIAKPYTSSGTYISVGEGWTASSTDFSASDEYIISDFEVCTLSASETVNGLNHISAVAFLGEKNGNVDIEASTKLNGINRTGNTTLPVSGFDIKLLYAEIILSSSQNILVGDTLSLTTIGYLSDGNAADMTQGSIVYSSETPDIISVDEYGTVTAIGNGIGSVKATLSLDGNTVTKTIDIEVADKTPVISAELYGEETVGYLRDNYLVLSGKRESGLAADFSNVEVKWVVSSDPVGGVSVDSNGLVFGHTFGATAEIYAEVIQEGRENIKTNTITVTVVESDLRDVMINFGDASCEPADVSLEAHGWEINKSKSHSSSLDASLSSEGLYSKTKSGVLAIDVHVPYEGAYQVIFYSTYSGSNARMADMFVDDIFIGTHDYGAAGMQMSKLRTVYLTAGTHTFYFDAVTAGKNGKYYHTLYKLHLAAREELASIADIETSSEHYELAVGAEGALDTKVLFDDGTYFTGRQTYVGTPDPMAKISYSASDLAIASVSDDGVITANALGEASVKVSVETAKETKEKEIVVSVSEDGESDTLGQVEISASSFVMAVDSNGVQFSAIGKSASGKTIVDLKNAEIIWESSDNAVVSIDQNGFATPVSIGTAEIKVTVALDGILVDSTSFVSVRNGKTGRTYYTDDMVSAARENILRYSWAKAERDAAVKAAEKYLGLEEVLWNIVPGQDIPRSNSVGYKTDPDMHYCRYCGAYLYDKYGRRGYSANPISKPWKIQCQECKRFFPSNDFESFYKLGLDEHGVFNRELAHQRNAELVANGEDGYLVNVLYPELYDPTSNSYNKDPRTGDVIDGRTWGVDDGMGYDTGRVIASSGIAEVHTYIAYYHHVALWYDGASDNSVIWNALDSLSKAYIYTGEAKYGRVGAILLDRIADLYPSYDIRPYLKTSNNKGSDGIFYVSSGGSTAGKTIGRIWETFVAEKLALSYDAFFPAYDDPYVVNFLEQKAAMYQIENDKSTPELIRQNCENGILREIYKGANEAQIYGNFGMVQANIAMVAVVLDTYPETQEMIDWIFAQSKTDAETYNTGGGVTQRLVEDVSRDGQGNESAPGYNKIWITDLSAVASTLARYPQYTGMDLYKNPKYIGMIKSYAPLTVVRRGVPPIGDSSMTANYSKLPNDDAVMIEAFSVTRDPLIAQHFYKMKGGETKGLHYDIFTRNPESLTDDLEQVIEEYGEYNYDKSSLLTGYGFGALRSGTIYDSNGVNVIRDIQRDFWMYFGGAISHSNYDKLTLGIEAYGIPFTTDLGYPEATGTDPNKHQWLNTTLAHNAVVVNEKNQLQFDFSQQPLHFDALNTRVKVMDIDASPVYVETDEYRRTIVMIDYDSDISYGIDFFKVSGGDDHIYSFHACSEENPITSDNITFAQQEGGTYAGADVPFGNDPWTDESNATVELKYPKGYTWLYDIFKSENPGENEFWFDFSIKDYRGFSNNGNMDHRLRMTVLNDFDADEITLANGMPPRTGNNLPYIEHLEYMLIRRKGDDLNSLFTTVIEPYNSERYIKNIENVPVSVSDSSDVQPEEGDYVKAVKVELVDGRTDYIVYAQNNMVTYNVGGIFEFKGFVGVWTLNAEDTNIYSYVNDGEMIGSDEKRIENLDAELTGTIVDFQRTLSFDNWIEVEFDRDLTSSEAEIVVDRLLNIDNPTKLGNSSFIIQGVEMKDSRTAVLDLGEITLIDGFVDPDNESLGYSYDAAVGKKVTIPLSYEENNLPVFDSVSDTLSTSAGSSISVKVHATAYEGNVTYSARTLPRGASFDESNAIFTWNPSSSQLGKSLVGIDATDESGRTSTLYFTITVYGATTGGGGSGATAPSNPTPDTGSDDDEGSTTNPDDGTTTKPEDGNGADAENIRFIDLGNHAWAADSINSLADDGIVKGTTPNTYSPANNITRADFALLLVRAFELESDNAENFDDVSDSDYFAAELAIARNTGIVNGIGNNKYAPRNTITRQDMMLILYRALVNLGVEFEIAEIDYPDVTDISDYAEEAVKALVSAGLVNGKSGRLAPKDYTTRAEVAVLLKRILEYITTASN